MVGNVFFASGHPWRARKAEAGRDDNQGLLNGRGLYLTRCIVRILLDKPKVNWQVLPVFFVSPWWGYCLNKDADNIGQGERGLRFVVPWKWRAMWVEVWRMFGIFSGWFSKNCLIILYSYIYFHWYIFNYMGVPTAKDIRMKKMALTNSMDLPCSFDWSGSWKFNGSNQRNHRSWRKGWPKSLWLPRRDVCFEFDHRFEVLEPRRCKCNNYTPANFFRFCLSSVDCLPATLQEKDQKTEAKIKDWLINAQSYSVVTAAIIVIYDDMYLYMYICIMY